MSRSGLWKRISGIALAVSLIGGLSACGSGSSGSQDTHSGTVKIGVADGGSAYWNVYKDRAKEEGIDVEFVNFSDYNQPNPALKQKQIDLNEFQHVRYLANYNVQNNDTLQPIGATAIYPLQLFSKKYKSTQEIPKGGQIALSNNTANQIRPILSLEAAGLIKLKNGEKATWDSKIDDVDKEASQVELVPTAPELIANSLDSIAGGFVDDTYSEKAGLTDKDAIYTDDPNNPQLKQYINVFVTRDEDKDNATYKKLAELYHDPKVKEAIQKESGDKGIFKDNSAEDLQDTLKQLEQHFKDQKQ